MLQRAGGCRRKGIRGFRDRGSVGSERVGPAGPGTLAPTEWEGRASARLTECVRTPRECARPNASVTWPTAPRLGVVGSTTQRAGYADGALDCEPGAIADSRSMPRCDVGVRWPTQMGGGFLADFSAYVERQR